MLEFVSCVFVLHNIFRNSTILVFVVFFTTIHMIKKQKNWGEETLHIYLDVLRSFYWEQRKPMSEKCKTRKDGALGGRDQEKERYIYKFDIS